MKSMVRKSVRLLIVVLFMAVCAVAPPTARAGDGAFVPGFDDLPLAAGLTGKEDGVMVFDTPGGRIVEARVAGPGSPDAVMEFYGKTLPQLGWTALGKGRFTREGEVLSIEAQPVPSKGGATVTVRFSLSPESR